MKNDLITLAFIAIFASALVLPGLGRYMDMNLERRLEHELKMACINAGKTLIEGSCT
jgi:hypothetical protein